MITAVSVRGRDASAEWLLPWSSMTGSEHLGRQVRVEQRRSQIGQEQSVDTSPGSVGTESPSMVTCHEDAPFSSPRQVEQG